MCLEMDNSARENGAMENHLENRNEMDVDEIADLSTNHDLIIGTESKFGVLHKVLFCIALYDIFFL